MIEPISFWQFAWNEVGATVLAQASIVSLTRRTHQQYGPGRLKRRSVRGKRSFPECLNGRRHRLWLRSPGAAERTARLKIQGPSGKGWSASISSASAATLSVLGAT